MKARCLRMRVARGDDCGLDTCMLVGRGWSLVVAIVERQVTVGAEVRGRGVALDLGWPPERPNHRSPAGFRGRGHRFGFLFCALSVWGAA